MNLDSYKIKISHSSHYNPVVKPEIIHMSYYHYTSYDNEIKGIAISSLKTDEIDTPVL